MRTNNNQMNNKFNHNLNKKMSQTVQKSLRSTPPSPSNQLSWNIKETLIQIFSMSFLPETTSHMFSNQIFMRWLIIWQRSFPILLRLDLLEKLGKREICYSWSWMLEKWWRKKGLRWVLLIRLRFLLLSKLKQRILVSYQARN